MATSRTKKVTSPIDERETFVSLQRTFADSEDNVQEKLKTLYALQQADNAIEKIYQLRGELPVEVSEMEGDVSSIEGKINQTEAVIEQFGKTVEDKRHEIVELDGEIADYRAKLEGISNSREFDSINKEVENLELLRQIAEKNIRETQEAAADKRDRLEELKRRLDIRRDDLAAKKEELDRIIGSTAEEEATLVKKRDELASKVDERTLSAYNRIRSSVHNHLAVVTVYNGDACGGCFNAITPQRLVDIATCHKLIICEHCGRIIVSDQIDK